MKEAAFQELLASAHQAGRIRRGTLKPARTTVSKPADVKAVRAKLGVSQAHFALMLGVSVAALRNWEQGRRMPEGPTLALLRVAAKHPEVVVDALHGNRGGVAASQVNRTLQIGSSSCTDAVSRPRPPIAGPVSSAFPQLRVRRF